MNKLNLSRIARTVQMAMTKHAPGILTGIGIAGMITTTVMAVKATPKAIKLLEEEREKQEEPLTKIEIVKAAWKPYIPAIVTGSLSAACLIGANSVNAGRNAALATAYNLSKTAFTDYKEKVVETVGEKKEKEIRDEVAKEHIDRNPVKSKEVIITEKGSTLCYDRISGRYFRGDIEVIRKAENELNRRLRSEMYVSVNDFYYEIGLDPIDLGEELGWNIDEGSIEFDFSSQLAKDDTPCLVVGYNIAPRYDFRRLM